MSAATPAVHTPAHGPEFLCIGAPKTGTTWLYAQLAAHPDVWVPPVKELHYFDRVFPLPRAGTKQNDPKGLFGLFPLHSRRAVLGKLAGLAARGRAAELRWAWRYYNGEPGEEWYYSLFAAAAGLTRGEFTTGYCALSDEAVDWVSGLLPESRVLFLMRDPVERAWSHARMLVPKLLGKPLASVGTGELLEYVGHPAARLRGDYLRTLAHWEPRFPGGRFFTGFYDDIGSDPAGLMSKVLDFLAIGAHPAAAARLERRVNAGPRQGRTMPDEARAHISRLYIDDLEALADRFGEPVTAWLERASIALGRSRAA